MHGEAGEGYVTHQVVDVVFGEAVRKRLGVGGTVASLTGLEGGGGCNGGAGECNGDNSELHGESVRKERVGG